MATQELIVSVSGIRGHVGAGLTPPVALAFAAAFGTPLTGQTVVVSRDGRGSGAMLQQAVVAGLLGVGCKVLDLGVAATPTCAYFVRHSGAAGGIQITASHNPAPYNGLKLFRPEGFVVSPVMGLEIAERYHRHAWTWQTWDQIGSCSTVADPHAPHLDRVLQLIDGDLLRRRRFRVLLDANHGSGATFGPRLLQEFGCDVIVLGGQPDGQFAHEPEPTATNLQAVCQMVREANVDIGFAVDPDADRLALIDSTGRYLGEENTLALALLHRLQIPLVAGQLPEPTTSILNPSAAPASLSSSIRWTGPALPGQVGEVEYQPTVVINGSTSRVTERVALSAHCQVIRTPVGEVHVAERMLAEAAVFGGEGNGGVIDPRVGHGRDSAIGMALILELMAQREMPLSALAAALPQFAIRKDKFPIGREQLPALFERFYGEFADAQITSNDGVRAEWPDAWVQVRASNTEPIVRVIAEADEQARADALCDRIGAWIR